jgi:hypothetical protein
VIAPPAARNGPNGNGSSKRGPAEPRAECGEQLEVSVTHAFDAAHELEYPVDYPQYKIARNRAGDRTMQAGEHAVEIDDQPGPKQWQRQRVGQQVRVDVYRARGKQRGAQTERGECHRGRTEHAQGSRGAGSASDLD